MFISGHLHFLFDLYRFATMNNFAHTILIIHYNISKLTDELKVEKDHMNAQHLSEKIAANEKAVKILLAAG